MNRPPMPKKQALPRPQLVDIDGEADSGLPAPAARIAVRRDAEIAQLELLMRNKHSEYWRGPHAARHQRRYRELIDERNAATKWKGS